MNAEQINATQAVKATQAVNKTENKTTIQLTTRLLKQYRVDLHQEVKIRKSVSETSSAMQKREERMKKIVIKFETKLRLKTARFKKTKFEFKSN